MTRLAEDEGFAATGRHQFDPCWFLSTRVFVQVFESPDMMHFDLFCLSGCPARLALLSEEPLFELGSTGPHPVGGWVFRCGIDVPGQWDTSPGGYQRVFFSSWNHDAQSFVHFSIHQQVCPIAVIDLPDEASMFARERFDQ